MLFCVDHHLGDSRKSAREVCPSRLFCFTAGFSESPSGVVAQAGRCGSTAVHKSTATAPISLKPAVDPNTGLVTANVFNGTRQVMPQGTKILLDRKSTRLNSSH